LALLGSVAFITCTYAPGVLIAEHRNAERLALTFAFAVAWFIGFKVLKPIKALKMLRTNTSAGADVRNIRQ
jgi:hypothetical protein